MLTEGLDFRYPQAGKQRDARQHVAFLRHKISIRGQRRSDFEEDAAPV
jgi:hypothetical protein